MDSLVWLGDVSLAAGKLDVAEASFVHAMQLDPNSVSAKFGAGRTALARGDHRQAVEYLEDVLRLNPKATAAHYPVAGLRRARHADKAAEHLRCGRQQDFAARHADGGTGRCCRVCSRSKRPASASLEDGPVRRQLRKGLALAPDNAALHRSGTALSMDDAAGARREFERPCSSRYFRRCSAWVCWRRPMAATPRPSNASPPR
jgi:tetratricopeptide (TPR) repeat protein